MQQPKWMNIIKVSTSHRANQRAVAFPWKVESFQDFSSSSSRGAAPFSQSKHIQPPPLCWWKHIPHGGGWYLITVIGQVAYCLLIIPMRRRLLFFIFFTTLQLDSRQKKTKIWPDNNFPRFTFFSSSTRSSIRWPAAGNTWQVMDCSSRSKSNKRKITRYQAPPPPQWGSQSDGEFILFRIIGNANRCVPIPARAAAMGSGLSVFQVASRMARDFFFLSLYTYPGYDGESVVKCSVMRFLKREKKEKRETKFHLS